MVGRYPLDVDKPPDPCLVAHREFLSSLNTPVCPFSSNAVLHRVRPKQQEAERLKVALPLWCRISLSHPTP